MRLLRASSIVVAALASTGLAASLASAQKGKGAPPASAAQQQQHEQSTQSPSGQAGKEEPSARAPASPQGVFVDGKLAVPGAPIDGETVPAKFSAKNAADDRLVTVAYTFKKLSDEERRAIFQALKAQPPGKAFNAEIGDELPAEVELRTVPDDVAARVPQTRGYRYAVADNRVLLVGTTRIVVGAVSSDGKEPQAGGRRSP